MIKITLFILLACVAALGSTGTRTSFPIGKPLPKEAAAQNHLYSGPWYWGLGWSSSACDGKNLNRADSYCYNEFLAVTTYYTLDRLRNEVLKDVNTCNGNARFELYDPWDTRNNDPDYGTISGSRKYCETNTGITTYEARWNWMNNVAKKLTDCEAGIACTKDEYNSVVVEPTAFYTLSMKHWFEDDFGVIVDDPNGPYEDNDFSHPYSMNPKPVEQPNFSEVEPTFSGWQRPTNRPTPKPTSLGIGNKLPVFVTYNNDKIQLTVNSTSANGTCLTVLRVDFLAETDGDLSKSFEVSGCNQLTWEFPKGMGTWDDTQKYWFTTTESYSWSWDAMWFRTSLVTDRNNFSVIEIWFKWPGNDSWDNDIVYIYPPSNSYVKAPRQIIPQRNTPYSLLWK